jgi:hypothetical protein
MIKAAVGILCRPRSNEVQPDCLVAEFASRHGSGQPGSGGLPGLVVSTSDSLEAKAPAVLAHRDLPVRGPELAIPALVEFFGLRYDAKRLGISTAERQCAERLGQIR